MRQKYTPEQTDTLLHDESKNVLLVDGRDASEYKISAISWAEHIPFVDLRSHLERLRTYDEVVVYCNSWNRSGMCMQQLWAEELEVVSELEWWIQWWQRAGLPVDKKKNTISLMRQTMLAAGLLVLLGVLWSVVIDPRFVWVAGFVWCGLTLSWATWFCGMTKLLAVMPWNR